MSKNLKFKIRRRSRPRAVDAGATLKPTTSVEGKSFPGGDGGRVTPVPISNTEVKPSSADGTALETRWESRTLPGFYSKSQLAMTGTFFVVRSHKWERLRYAPTSPFGLW